MIAAFIARVWARIWPYIAAAGAALAAVLAIRQSGRAAGRAEAEAEQSDATAGQRRKINEADTQMAAMDDDGIRRELRKWVRPDDAEGR